MNRIQSALRIVCERSDLQVPPDVPLGEVAGWDSMRAVTFQMELENIFSVDLSDVMILGSSTLADVADMLRQKGATLNPIE